jgi:hypothetical protein
MTAFAAWSFVPRYFSVLKEQQSYRMYWRTKHRCAPIAVRRSDHNGLTGHQESFPQLNSNLGGNNAVVPTTAYSQAEDALNLVRALVNDSAGVVFTDTLLMPLLNCAYRGL